MFLAILKKDSFFVNIVSFFFHQHLQKSIKSYVSDTNGRQKRVFRVENMLIDPGQTDF